MISSPVFCNELVGRQDELAFLLARLQRAADGAGTFVLVKGEAGIGKSRLLEEFRKLAAAQGVPVLAGSCLEYAQSPYAPLIEALSPLHGPHARSVGARAGSDTDAAFVKLPESQSWLRDNSEKLRYFATYAQRLHERAHTKPIVLAIENLQWADAGTLELIDYLSTYARNARILLIVTFRPDGFSNATAIDTLIAKLARTGAALLELKPLSDGDMIYLERRLLGGMPLLSHEVVERIRELSEGNPLLAEELTRSALDAKENARDFLEEGTSLSIRTVIRERLRRFTKRERDYLMQAAVIGRSFDADFLAGIVGCSIMDLLSVLRRARNYQMIVEQPGSADRYTFRHAMIREVVYRELLASERVRLHAKIAASLEATSGPDRRLAEFAYHWAEAGHASKAAQYAEAAGDAAVEVYAFRDATRFYRRALEFVANRGKRRATLWEKLGIAYLWSGSSEAIEQFERAIHEYRRIGDVEKMARMLLFVARQNLLNGKTDESLRTAAHALDVLGENSASPLKLVAKIQMARYSTLLSRPEEALEYLASAGPIDKASPEVISTFYDVRGLAHANVGKTTEAFSDFRRSMKAARVNRDLEAMVLTLNNCAFSASFLGRAPLAVSCYERALKLARERGLVARTAFVSLSYARTCLRLGHLAQAKELVESALGAGVEANVNRFVAAEVGIAVGMLLENDLLVRRCADEEVIELAIRSGESERMGPVIAAFADQMRANGRTQEAAALLHRGVSSISSADQCWWMLTRVAAYGLAGDLERARMLLEQSVTRYDLAVAAVHLALFDALVAARDANDAECSSRAKSAANGFARLRWPYHQAQALEIAGDPREALAIYRQIGDSHDVRRLEAASSYAKRRGRPNTALTLRESEVAELICDGQTSREIAQKLGISEHTVIHHVESIFNRLGIKSRSQLAAHIARQRAM